MAEQSLFSTRDIYLASVLVTLGHRVVTVDYQLEGTRGRPVGYFSFEDNPELRKTETDFMHGNLRLEPRALFQSLKAMKGVVNNTYKSPRSPFNRAKFS